ncbi:MAG: DM13 domain-containing protein [Actinomycetota bacterium]
MSLRPRRLTVVWLSAAVAMLLAGGLAWFQPWKLWLDQRVDEALPAIALIAAATPTPDIRSTDPATPPPNSTPSPIGPVLLSTGRFISHEHITSGSVSVVELPDGSRILAIAGLNTSNGPDLHVWLSDAPVLPGSDGWHLFDDGSYLSLGTLKGNLGNQSYPIPRTADLSRLASVTIWCARFKVSFGAAALRAA